MPYISKLVPLVFVELLVFVWDTQFSFYILLITPATNKGDVPYEPILAVSNARANPIAQTNTSCHENVSCDIPIILNLSSKSSIFMFFFRKMRSFMSSAQVTS